MLSQSDLQQLVATFDEPGAFHGLLLHGSFARESADAASDIDLICVKRAGRREKRQARFLGRNVDLHLSPPGLIRRAFARVQASNNNVVLNAFVSGRILVDRGGVVEHLVKDALAAWQKGPPPIPRTQQARRVSRLVKALERSQRSVSRTSSPVSAELGRILADRVFRETISVYCRINRRWASSLHETMEWFRRDDPQFYQLCEQYLLSTTLELRVARLQSIVGATVTLQAMTSLKQ
jgi:predicted nucleotidyltransferase